MKNNGKGEQVKSPKKASREPHGTPKNVRNSGSGKHYATFDKAQIHDFQVETRLGLLNLQIPERDDEYNSKSPYLENQENGDPT